MCVCMCSSVYVHTQDVLLAERGSALKLPLQQAAPSTETKATGHYLFPVWSLTGLFSPHFIKLLHLSGGQITKVNKNHTSECSVVPQVRDLLDSVSHPDWEHMGLHSGTSSCRTNDSSPRHVFSFFPCFLNIPQVDGCFLSSFSCISDLLSGLQGVWCVCVGGGGGVGGEQRRDTAVILPPRVEESLGHRCVCTQRPPPHTTPPPPTTQTLRKGVHASSHLLCLATPPAVPPPSLPAVGASRSLRADAMQCPLYKKLASPLLPQLNTVFHRSVASPWNLNYFFYFCLFQFF